MIYTTTYDSPIGAFFLASDDIGLIGVWMDGQKYFADSIKTKSPISKETDILSQTKHWLDLYFSGKNPDFLLILRRSPASLLLWFYDTTGSIFKICTLMSIIVVLLHEIYPNSDRELLFFIAKICQQQKVLPVIRPQIPYNRPSFHSLQVFSFLPCILSDFFLFLFRKCLKKSIAFFKMKYLDLRDPIQDLQFSRKFIF